MILIRLKRRIKDYKIFITKQYSQKETYQMADASSLIQHLNMNEMRALLVHNELLEVIAVPYKTIGRKGDAPAIWFRIIFRARFDPDLEGAFVLITNTLTYKIFKNPALVLEFLDENYQVDKIIFLRHVDNEWNARLAEQDAIAQIEPAAL